MLNTRLLAAWPNWLIIPAMLAFWVIVLVLGQELISQKSFTQE